MPFKLKMHNIYDKCEHVNIGNGADKQQENTTRKISVTFLKCLNEKKMLSCHM